MIATVKRTLFRNPEFPESKKADFCIYQNYQINAIIESLESLADGVFRFLMT